LTDVVVKNAAGTVLSSQHNTYDVFDRRIGISTTIIGVTTQMWTVYDGANTYADFDGNGNLTNRYLYGLAVDQLFGKMDASGNTRWYLTDRLGSVRLLTSPSGSVLDSVNYDSFGNILSESNPANGDRFKFAGRESDGLFGQYYNRARELDPVSGRFTSSDPGGFSGGDANLYRYVYNLPAVFVDPTGTTAGFPGTLPLPRILAIPGVVPATLISGCILGTYFGFLWIAQTFPQEIARVFANEPVNLPKEFKETYDHFEDAIGETSIDGATDVKVTEANNENAIEQGYTEHWLGRKSDGSWHSAFRNPKTGKFAGGHESSHIESIIAAALSIDKDKRVPGGGGTGSGGGTGNGTGSGEGDGTGGDWIDDFIAQTRSGTGPTWHK
jgi:RHS repeat-associated protein